MKDRCFRHGSLVLLMVLMALRSQLAAASTCTFTFGGTLTQGLAGSPYMPGRAYTAYFDLDTTQLSPSGPGLYYATIRYGFDVSFSGFSASSLGSGVLVANDQPLNAGGSFDGIIFSMFGEQSTGFPAGALFDGSAFGITLVNNSAGPTATPFVDTSFPSTLNLSQFSERFLTVYFSGGTVKGTVDSFSITGDIPEPSAWGLLLVGLAMLLKRRPLTA
jgi:hypothetical protein